MSATVQVHVDGGPLSSLSWWGDLVITHRWPYGCWEMTWSMPLRRHQRFTAIRAGVSVEAKIGGYQLWAGFLGEPNYADGTMTAFGEVRAGEEALCLTAGGLTTSVPNTAVDQAITRGALRWIRRQSLSAIAFADGDNTNQLNYVTALLDAWSTEQNKRWAVSPYREVYAAADPTEPSLYVAPDTGVLGVADEAQASAVFGRYRNSGAGGRLATTSVGTGVPEVGVTLTQLGPMSTARAQSILTGIRNRSQARTGWTNGITVMEGDVTRRGGVPAHFANVVAGRMVRLQGLRDQRGLSASTDVVLGETVWSVAQRSMQLNPVGLAARDLASVVSRAGGVLL